jgi:hypothetical protein
MKKRGDSTCFEDARDTRDSGLLDDAEKLIRFTDL